MIKLLITIVLSCFISSVALAQKPHDVKRYYNPQTGKRVLFVEMRHFDTATKYEATRRMLDSLKAEGYVTFGEGVLMQPFTIDTIADLTNATVETYKHTKNRGADSIRLDTLIRKFRYIFGAMISKGGYTDPNNESLPNKLKDTIYVSQTRERLGMMTDQDLWVDYPIVDLIAIFERRYRVIHLTDYDFETGLYKKYAPEKAATLSERLGFSLWIRNHYLTRRIVTSPHPKIAVIYGSAHTPGVVYDLRKKYGFRKDKRK